MKIQEIRIKRIDREDSTLKAFCSINFEGKLVIHGIRLIDGEKGYFLSFPSVVRKGIGFTDVAHPIDADFRAEITKQVIEQYNQTPPSIATVNKTEEAVSVEQTAEVSNDTPIQEA